MKQINVRASLGHLSSKRVIGFLAFIVFNSALFSQADSTMVLDFAAFMERVKLHHPVSIQADIKVEEGEANELKARGAFDPVVYTEYDSKEYSDKNYYDVLSSGLKIPTWWGVEIKAGFEQTDGLFLNPAETTPDDGLWNAGLVLPLGRNLRIDERRLALKKAAIYKESSQMERLLIRNELLYEAASAYWDWLFAYQKMNVYKEAEKVASQRFNGVIQSAVLGEKAAIDTLEASIQYQNRVAVLNDAELHYKNSTIMLSLYLWEEGTIPLEIDSGTVPQPIDRFLLETNRLGFINTSSDSLLQNHPMLRQYAFKIDQLELDQRWKREQLKPVLNLQYSLLSTPINNGGIPDFSLNNYKWGIQFKMPILFRKERGDLQLTNLKIQDAQLSFLSKQAQVKGKVTSALNEWETAKAQIEIYSEMADNYKRLFDAEQQLFDIGESSLFMVNSRESGYLSARLKYLSTVAKSNKAAWAYYYALGAMEMI